MVIDRSRLSSQEVLESLGPRGGPWSGYLATTMLPAGEEPFPQSSMSGESLTTQLDRHIYDGEIRGQQDILVLAPDALALLTNFDFVRRYSYEMAGDKLVMIQFRLEGAMSLTSGDCQRSFDRPVCILSYCPPGLTREINVAGGPWRGVGLFCRESALARWGLLNALPAQLQERLHADDAGFYVASLGLSHDMLENVRGMMTCAYDGDLRRAYTEAKSIEIICSVLAQLQNLSEEDADNARFSPADVRRVKSAHALIEAELAEPHTLATVARRVGLNRSKLAAAFKHLYGATFFDRLCELRMDAACRLLEDDEATIAGVAQAVGYEAPCSFARAFKRRYGVAPRMTRQRTRADA